MYAIIETGGRQFWVAPGETIRVETLDVPPGQELTLTALWAVDDPKDGQEPKSSTNAEVAAEIVRQGRAPKIIVYKRRSKKAYKKLQGHRQSYTEIRIKTISIN